MAFMLCFDDINKLSYAYSKMRLFHSEPAYWESHGLNLNLNSKCFAYYLNYGHRKHDGI